MFNQDYEYEFNKTDFNIKVPQYDIESPWNYFEAFELKDWDYKREIDLSEDFERSLFPIDHDFFTDYAFKDKMRLASDSVEYVENKQGQVLEIECTQLADLSKFFQKSTACSGKKFDFSCVEDIKQDKRKRHGKLSIPSRRRKDIVFKSLLRRCRKFYQFEFNKFCNYSKVKKRRSKEYFYEQVNKYVAEKFDISSFPELSFYFAAFVYAKDTKAGYIESYVNDLVTRIQYQETDKSTLSEQKNEIVNTTHDILSKFTHEKMITFFECEQLTFFFKNYVEKAQDYIPKGFKSQLDTMLEFANSSECNDEKT